MIWLKTKLLALGGIIVGLLAIFFAGTRHQKQKERIKDLEEYKETKERIDSVKPTTDRESAIKWLSDNGQLR